MYLRRNNPSNNADSWNTSGLPASLDKSFRKSKREDEEFNMKADDKQYKYLELFMYYAKTMPFAELKEMATRYDSSKLLERSD